MNPPLAAAVARMDTALGRLEAVVTRHLDTDLRRSDLEIELQVMGDDRSRLATELDVASGRVAQLEHATEHVGARIGAAISSIQDILAAQDRGQDPA